MKDVLKVTFDDGSSESLKVKRSQSGSLDLLSDDGYKVDFACSSDSIVQLFAWRRDDQPERPTKSVKLPDGVASTEVFIPGEKVNAVAFGDKVRVNTEAQFYYWDEEQGAMAFIPFGAHGDDVNGSVLQDPQVIDQLRQMDGIEYICEERVARALPWRHDLVCPNWRPFLRDGAAFNRRTDLVVACGLLTHDDLHG